ncbi:MAG TPA: hydrogenase expression/formation protein HypE [Candidatus Gemmiger faecavium]|nr:hydrogenase expression/formation protein HypE [Candidatus Gemmiger faecavium]
MKEIVTLDHGSGGLRTSELIEQVLLPAYGNTVLNELGDGAVLPDLGGQPVFSTDSFVVTPWRFPGGDIGKLAVCGTVNDICMAGGEPKYLSLALILEEGFAMDDLRAIVASAAETARRCGVRIVTGDTKVVARGQADGIYINTAGIGRLRAPGLGKSAIRPGDAVLVSGSVGCHGAAVMMARGDIPCEGTLLSDCRPLHELSAAALNAGGVRILRDPTRGGVATTLNEFVEGGPLCIELDEDAIPVEPSVAAACDLLGLDPLYAACEGRMLAVVAPGHAEAVLQALRALPGGEGAVQIGRVTETRPGQVVLNAAFGSRILGKLTGAQLPRIC